MQKLIKIGGVTLNLLHYSGVDLYSDGEIEDELLKIVTENTKEDFPRIIEERSEWPVLYHLSDYRSNIVEWIPMSSSDKVLEVGSGCGAITGMLSKKAGSVVSCDLSLKRSRVNAQRNSDCGNVTIHVGNFRDIEPELDTDFDYIFLIGVFEYGQGYIDTDNPYEDFLNMLSRHIKKGGRIVIAIENRLGLKYLAGCAEDHLGSYFSGIEGYSKDNVAKTFTKNGLIKIFENCGMNDYHFYYPYPDYKLMSVLYSDKRLPKADELFENVPNFDRDRLVLFNEKRAYEDLIKDGMYSDFANSFEVILGPGFDMDYKKYADFSTKIDSGTGKDKSMLDICNDIGKKAVVPKELNDYNASVTPKDRIQIYFDNGKGYSEKESIFPSVRYDDNNEAALEIEFDSKCKSVRIDPAFAPCITSIEMVSLNDKPILGRGIKVVVGKAHSKKLADYSYVFNSDDPNIELKIGDCKAKTNGTNRMVVKLITSLVTQDAADLLVNSAYKGWSVKGFKK